VTLTPAQSSILRAALSLRSGVPTRNQYVAPGRNEDPDCDAAVAAGLMLRCESLGGGTFYKVTGAGVRAVCPDARAAVYLTGEDVTVFTTRNGGYRMRWDAPDKGRFAQGMVYRVSAQAVRFKERR
jgi:hypothetical protein